MYVQKIIIRNLRKCGITNTKRSIRKQPRVDIQNVEIVAAAGIQKRKNKSIIVSIIIPAGRAIIVDKTWFMIYAIVIYQKNSF